MRTRTRYLSLAEASPGMVLESPVVVGHQGIVRFSLPQGHILTDDNLHQLRVHRTEFLFIAAPDPRSDEQVAVDAAEAARRTLEIFAGADLSDPLMAKFFDQVLTFRSA
jgi:hypothetical protein